MENFSSIFSQLWWWWITASVIWPDLADDLFLITQLQLRFLFLSFLLTNFYKYMMSLVSCHWCRIFEKENGFFQAQASWMAVRFMLDLFFSRVVWEEGKITKMLVNVLVHMYTCSIFTRLTKMLFELLEYNTVYYRDKIKIRSYIQDQIVES